MRTCGLLVLPVALLLSACSRQPATPAEPAAPVKGTLNQVMRGVLFPNSNTIFDAQDRDPGAPLDPTDPATANNPYANAYGGWEAVENASIALYEAANLIQLPGRTCQNGKPVPLEEETFKKGLAALRESSLYADKTAQAKNKDAIPDVGEKLAAACAACHDVYRDRMVDGKPIGMEDRCVAR